MDKETDVGKFYASLIGHVMNFNIVVDKVDGIWVATGTFDIGGTRDGKNYGSLQASVKAYEDSADAAIATTMLALGNYMNSDDFYTQLQSRIEESEIPGEEDEG